MIVLPATTRDIGELCSATHVHQKLENGSLLLKILQNIRFWIGKALHSEAMMIQKVVLCSC